MAFNYLENEQRQSSWPKVKLWNIALAATRIHFSPQNNIFTQWLLHIVRSKSIEIEIYILNHLINQGPIRKAETMLDILKKVDLIQKLDYTVVERAKEVSEVSRY